MISDDGKRDAVLGEYMDRIRAAGGDRDSIRDDIRSFGQRVEAACAAKAECDSELLTVAAGLLERLAERNPKISL